MDHTPRARGRFDAATFVERCYSLDATLAEWLHQLGVLTECAPVRRYNFARLFPHIEAALKLRESIAALSTRGALEGAAAGSGSALERLRELVRAAVEGATIGDGDHAFFGRLAAGRISLLDRFEAGGRRYTVALRHPRGVVDPRALTERELVVARLAALGAANKAIADALHLSESGAGTHLGRAMRKLGLCRRQAIVASMLPASAIDVAVGSSPLVIATTSFSLAAVGLSEAEREVAGSAMRGLSNREIARERGVSERTVANQIGSVFRKLGVCSRSELVTRSSG